VSTTVKSRQPTLSQDFDRIHQVSRIVKSTKNENRIGSEFSTGHKCPWMSKQYKGIKYVISPLNIIRNLINTYETKKQNNNDESFK